MKTLAAVMEFERLLIRSDGPQTREEVKNCFLIFRVLTGRDCSSITIPQRTLDAWKRWKDDDFAAGVVTVSDIVDFAAFRVMGADLYVGLSFKMA